MTTSRRRKRFVYIKCEILFIYFSSPSRYPTSDISSNLNPPSQKSQETKIQLLTNPNLMLRTLHLNTSYFLKTKTKMGAQQSYTRPSPPPPPYAQEQLTAYSEPLPYYNDDASYYGTSSPQQFDGMMGCEKHQRRHQRQQMRHGHHHHHHHRHHHHGGMGLGAGPFGPWGPGIVYARRGVW